MKLNVYVRAVAIFAILVPPLAAQPLQLSLGQRVGAPGDTVEIKMTLTTDINLSGISFHVKYDEQALNMLGFSSVVTPFSAFQTLFDGELRGVFLNSINSDVLPKGIHTLCVIRFVIRSNANVGTYPILGSGLSAISSHGLAEVVLDTAFEGVVVVTDQFVEPVLLPSSGSEGVMVAVHLTNTQGLAGGEMVVTWTNQALELNDIDVTHRTLGWDVFRNQTSPTALALVFADLGNPKEIDPGEGPILNLKFDVRDTTGTGCELSLERLLFTDLQGNAQPVTTTPLLIDKSEWAVVLKEKHRSDQEARGHGDQNSGAQGGIQPGVEGSGERIDLETDQPSEPKVPSEVGSGSNVKIVEILADPAPGLSGDANGDGVRESREDEFVEIMNLGKGFVDVSGWHLSDDDVSATGRFTFPESTQMSPGERIVLFGGGDIVGVPGQVFADDGSIGNGLTNTGDKVVLLSALGDTVDCVDFDLKGNKNQSIARVGSKFVLHKDHEGRTSFSPNRPRPVIDVAFPLPRFREVSLGDAANMVAYVLYTDGVDEKIDDSDVYWRTSDSTLVSITPNGNFVAKKEGTVDVWFAWNGRESLHAEINVLPGPDLFTEKDLNPTQGVTITEVHANPALGERGDTNGDGKRDGFEDEFVELVNASEDTVDLSGCYLGDNSKFSALFRLPLGTKLPPNTYLTLFGGGKPQGVSGLVYVDDGRIGDGLSNGGDIVRLVCNDGLTVVDERQFGESPSGRSFYAGGAGSMDLSHEFPGKSNFSPGRRRPMLVAIRLLTHTDTLVAVGDSIQLLAKGVFDDGDELSLGGGLVWHTRPEYQIGKKGVLILEHSGTIQIWASFEGVKSDTLSLTVDGSSRRDSVSNLPVDALPDTTVTPGWVDNVRDGILLREIHPKPFGENVLGKLDNYGDEFLEFENIGHDTIDLAGWFVGDDDLPNPTYQFPPQTQLLPGEMLVLWGDSPVIGQGRLSAAGRIGDGLDDGGDSVYLFPPDGVSAPMKWSYEGSVKGVSWLNDDKGGWIRHDTGRGLGKLSPGHHRLEISTLKAFSESTSMFLGSTMDVEVVGITQNGRQIDLTSSVHWTADSTKVEILGGVLKPRSPGWFSIQPMWRDLRGNEIRILVDEFPVSTDTSHVPTDLERGTPEVQANRAPVVQNGPDSIAISELTYRYEPDIIDSDGDSISVWLVDGPHWLTWDGYQFAGIPPVSDAFFLIRLGVTDGQDSTIYANSVRILPASVFGQQLGENVLYAGLRTLAEGVIPAPYEVQVEGPWTWYTLGQDQVFIPHGFGTIPLSLSISRDNESVICVQEFHVMPKPQLELVKIIMEPEGGDETGGLLSYSGKQMVVFTNAGHQSTDLSGWLFGELGKDSVSFPNGTVVEPGQNLSILNGKVGVGERFTNVGGTIGDGLQFGDRIGLMTPNLCDTLIQIEIPHLPNGKVLTMESGKWQVDLPETLMPTLGTHLNFPALDVSREQTVMQVGSSVFHPHPNPFMKNTQFGFYSLGGEVGVVVYSALGQPVKHLVNDILPPGFYSQIWDGTDDQGRPIASGIYLIHMQMTATEYTHRVACYR